MVGPSSATKILVVLRKGELIYNCLTIPDKKGNA